MIETTKPVTAVNRRRFLKQCGAGMLAGAASYGRGYAFPAAPAIPPGLQLYSVHELLPKAFQGTLNRIGALGFQEVEAAGLYGRSPEEVRAAMKAAGLTLVSAHAAFDDLQNKLDETLALHKALGAAFVICSSPGFKDPGRGNVASYRERMGSFTLEDFRWTADRLNAWGRAARAAGVQLGYHNYTVEFVRRDGVVPYLEMLRLTDPALVTFELDCGWAAVGGSDPVQLLRTYRDRFALLHVKDFKAATGPVTPLDPPPPAELGRGTVDFRALYAALPGTAVRHIFAEQEGYDMPPFDALRVDVNFLRTLQP